MTGPRLLYQFEAVRLAHLQARDQLAQAERSGKHTEVERAIKRQHIRALRAAGETLRTLILEELGVVRPPGAARVHHDALVEGFRADGQLPDFPPDFDVGAEAISESP